MMRWTIVTVFLALAGCSPASDGSADANVNDNVVPEPADTAQCLRMGVEKPPYPGTHTITEAETAEYETRAAEFVKAYRDEGVNMDAYRIDPRAATASPNIEWFGVAGVMPDMGILLTDEELDDSNASTVTAAFYERWSEFFNPYGAALDRGDGVPGDPGWEPGAYCWMNRCFSDYWQEFCGLPFARGYGQEQYQGGIYIVVWTDIDGVSTASLGEVQSGVVPQVPLPWAPAPTEAEVAEIVDGLEVERSCTDSLILGSESCVEKIDGPMILVEPAGDLETATTIEYRIVVYADVAPICGAPVEATVEIDLIERDVRRSWDLAGCNNN